LLTKDDIRKKLKENPDWAPEYNESDEVWELYDKVREELYGDDEGEDNISGLKDPDLLNEDPVYDSDDWDEDF